MYIERGCVQGHSLNIRPHSIKIVVLSFPGTLLSSSPTQDWDENDLRPVLPSESETGPQLALAVFFYFKKNFYLCKKFSYQVNITLLNKRSPNVYVLNQKGNFIIFMDGDAAGSYAIQSPDFQRSS